MKTKNITQSVTLPAAPRKIYASLMDSRRHTRFTGIKAKIENKIGGKFVCFDGYIEGINLELKKDKRIVQAWRSTNWPKGYYSVVIYNLAPAGKGRSRLTFRQVGVPSRDFKNKSHGWKKYYWEALKRSFEY
jgi:activator of HSP90 ATPase